MTQKPDNPQALVRVVVTPNSTSTGTVSVQYLDELPKPKSFWRRFLDFMLKAREATHD